MAAIDSLLNPELWAIMGRFAVNEPYSKEYRFVVEHLDDFQKRGVDRYALESQLGSAIGFQVNMLYLGFCQPDGQDSLPSLRRRAEQLEVLLRQPVVLLAAVLRRAAPIYPPSPAGAAGDFFV